MTQTNGAPRSFQEIILRLQSYWASKGCAMLQPYDMEVGAGTFHPATTLRSLGSTPWAAAYVQPSRRPTDGRYGENPNRLQHYYQYQVLIKPSPPNLQELYLGSLAAIGIDMELHDIRFVEDDWESPTLGAWGLGWEVWCDGMEVSQFTYFQQVGGYDCSPVSGELTYGLERLAMYVLGVDHVMDMPFNDPDAPIPMTYGDIFKQTEEYARWNFDTANTEVLLRHFEEAEVECAAILSQPAEDPKTGKRIVMAHPAYDQCIKASHIFNLLDARGVISVTERQAYIGRVRALAKQCADAFVQTTAGGWGGVTALFMQFHSFKKQLGSSVSYKTGNWRPVGQTIWARGSFVYDKGQDFWDTGQTLLDPDGFAILDVTFLGEANTGPDEPKSWPTDNIFWLTPLGDEGFEYSVELPASYMIWFLDSEGLRDRGYVFDLACGDER